MSLESIPNFLRLEEWLCCGGQPTAEQFREAARAGVQVVINLALDTSPNALPDEPALVRALGMEHIHIPVVWESPQPADLERFLNAMDAHAGKHILVHCALNYRATAFLGLWRVLRQGWPPEAAFAPQRAIWNLEDYPVWQDFITRTGAAAPSSPSSAGSSSAAASHGTASSGG